MERVRQITRVNEAHKLGYIGNNVTVAVMDTGIGTHIDFGQRIRGFRDYVGDKKILYDDNGHGTMFQELLQVPVLLLMDVTGGWHREQRYMR